MMSRHERAPLKLTDEARAQAIASIRQYFAAELDQEIGDLKAALVLDYFLTEIGPAVYNRAIADAKTFFDERAADLGALCSRDEFPYWPSATRRRSQ
jgi:uncharacterized protein (DUF2164 family)